MHPTSVLHETSPASAEVVAPILTELVHPESVLDVGCGIGAWLEQFRGQRTLGIDELDPDSVSCEYERHDLRRPFSVGRFDLALCLEVGEHLPPTSAPLLVESLVSSAPTVAFSAAIPGQRGHGHINCQWPEYWQELFAAHGYQQYDSIRARIWDDDRVATWYRQNLFLYSSEPFPEQRLPTRVVHPDHYLFVATMSDPAEHGVPELVRAFPLAARRALRRRLGRRRSA